MKRLGIALALSATTFGAHAAGLGRLNLMSGLGQPLRAEIELTSIARDEAGTLTARLAGADAFSQAGIEYGAALSSLRFSIQRRGNGSQYVLVTSNAQVNEPFLDLLVELNWGSGRLVREYTVLLDPPETRTAQQVDPAATIVAAQAPAAPTVVRRTPRADAAPADAAPAPAPVAAPTRRAPVAAVPSGASGTDYVVQNGDTAMSIARATKADNVSLEQMLAVLYRDNPQAFGGNINKLLAGASMKIPDAAAVQGVDSGEARRVIAQSSNFGAYRERVARGAADAPAARSSSQQASGRLSTQVQDQAAPTAAADRLQLSRPDATRPSTGTGGTRTGAAAGPSADELAAKDRELSETRTRLALLEKNVSDLQELLKLKNQTLADLQKAGGTAPSTAPAPAAAVATPTPAPVVAPTPVTPPVPAATAPAPVPTPAPAAATPTPAPVAPAPAATAPAPNGATGSWTDWVVDNVLLVAGFAILLLLLVGYFVVRRRKMSSRFEDSIFVDNSVLHANSVFGTTGGQSVDTANTGFHSNFVPVAGTLPEHNEVDPVAEADVYIAYGRDAQAEEILKEALRADATRHAVRLKLLEIYAKRGDAKTFETMASELYAATGGQGDDWRQAAALGASIDPRNPLYGESGAAAPAAAPTYSPPAAAAPMRAPAPAPAFAATDVNSPDALDFGISSIGITPSALGGDPDETVAVKGSTDHLRTDPMPRGPSASSPSMDLDFDLGNAGGPAPLQAAVPTAPAHDDAFDFTTSAASKPLADPFTASAFGAIDPAARTAVNLPAFRARADEPATPPSPATDGFTASDIFGSSIVADDSFGSAPTEIAPTGSPNTSSITAAAAARTMDFRHAVDNHQFDKTEPLDAFSKINLDLDDGDFPAVDGKTDFGNKTDVWQAMATKLDLALAYSDIGDKDGARELLEEVVRNGDQVQAERAKHLITELG